MKNLTAILLDEADVKDASAVMASLNDEANDAAMAAPIVIFRGQIVKNRFDSLTGAPAAGTIPAAIGAAFGGGVYAGIMRGVDGAPDYHLVLVDGAAEDLTWDAAVAWAKTAGGDLPSRREQRLLFINLKDQFEPEWYWSGEQYGPSSSDAWGQHFYFGTQNNFRKSYEGRARAVRRFTI